METLYDMIKENAEGKGEEMMWQSVSLISNTVDAELNPKAKDKLMRDVYALMNNGHYNEDFAKKDVEKMYYKDSEGQKHFAPYFNIEHSKALYESVKEKIPNYNEWDFFVTLNMIVSDYHNLMCMWFPEDTEDSREKKYVELSLNFLDDEDNPLGHTKIWSYFNNNK